MSLPATYRDFRPLPPPRRSALSGDEGTVDRIRTGVKLLASGSDGVLLVKEARRDGPDFWTLPGGGLWRSEAPRAGLKREVAEELGCEVDVDRPVTRCSYRHTSRPDTVSVYTVYRGTLDGEVRPNPAEGIVDHAWTEPPVPADTLRPFRQVIRRHAEAGDR